MKSILHPNGFFIKLIHVFKNGSRIRLHYWIPNYKRLESPHNHRSWFISIPLWGIFTEKRFQESNNNNDFTVIRCHATT